MDKLVIKGGKKLKGTVVISGSKNAALPILAATLLTDDTCVLKNVPYLSDINTMIKLLRELGKDISMIDDIVTVRGGDKTKCRAPYDLVST
ncbi:MAG: UDP-N-acetylglucosamine 1-carboxyvinyltransferase, partial [Candidatus Omnitrophica bacterium]|nr:UDP-N-acetylglucosamine 1-carboxyvinyltransferase [Candidatus Omnitrophota bacterium]